MSPRTSKLVWNWQRYKGFTKFYPFLPVCDKTLNISVSFSSIYMIFSYFWRGNRGVQKTGPKRPVFLRSSTFKYQRPRLQSSLFSGPVRSSCGLFPVLRLDFQTLLLITCVCRWFCSRGLRLIAVLRTASLSQILWASFSDGQTDHVAEAGLTAGSSCCLW